MKEQDIRIERAGIARDRELEEGKGEKTASLSDDIEAAFQKRMRDGQ